MNELLAAALAYARSGWAVFPVHGIVNGSCTCGRQDCGSPGKHPLVKRGVHEATTDQSQIITWWKRWRSGNVGLATGRASGIVVIDVDVPAGESSLELLHRMDRALPQTLSARSGGCGRHLYYRAPGHDLGNSVGSLPGIEAELPGIDLRAEGGYVLTPPSPPVSGERYEWLDPCAEIAEVPAWLREPPRRPVALPSRAAVFEGDGTRLGVKVLRKQLSILARARVGQRNHTLNRCAFTVAHYVAAGHLLDSAARAELTRVGSSIGLTRGETARTIDSAFSAVGGGIR